MLRVWCLFGGCVALSCAVLCPGQEPEVHGTAQRPEFLDYPSKERIAASILKQNNMMLLHRFARAAFYYLWYGTPETDGAWRHWDHAVLPHWDARVRVFAWPRREVTRE